MADLIITAQSVITMDAALPRAKAVAVSGDRIVAVGSLDDCRKACPGAEVRDLGERVLLPGFVESHSHPLLSGIVTMKPAYYIAPWVAATWDDVLEIFETAKKEVPADKPMMFFGFDALLHGTQPPTAATLDEIFGDRMAVVSDNSGHAAYVTSAVMADLGWLDNPPPDPVGGSFGRDADGKLTGVAYEVAAVLAIAAPVLSRIGGNPLGGPQQYYALLARAGITSVSEMTYKTMLKPGYEALAATPGCPLRVSLYHMSIEDDAGQPLDSRIPAEMLVKQGIKLWADGSPWVGNVATSFNYLDTEHTRRAGIPLDPGADKAMNYSRAQLDAILDKYAPQGWQMSFHVNGDVGLDIVLDAYERALVKHGLLGTDHRWRLEHVGAGRGDQFQRAGELGVVASMAPFQFYYWGDLLDGQLFTPDIGAAWQRFREAFDAGLHPAFHNDGSVSPPTPLLNIQTAVTRRTSSGALRGPGHAVTLTEALMAETSNAAYILRRDDLVGSITPGKLADFVELSADPYEVDPRQIASVKVEGTWLGGRQVNLDAFLGT